MAFDCDGTIRLGGGPIKVELLEKLQAKGDDEVVIVSNSLSCWLMWEKNGGKFAAIPEGPLTRKKALQKAKWKYRDCRKFIYVSDNVPENKYFSDQFPDVDDRRNAHEAGFKFLLPKQFKG